MTSPTLYEYYTAGGITTGLSANQSYFTLNERNITFYSGAMHYFRTPKQLWRDRLRKFRAAGLNAVETYVPWNLHEPSPGVFDFGEGGTDMEDFLDIEGFIRTAQEEDLFTILRPGPYICAEWEFGGFPSWLLREKTIKFRSSDETYMGYVKRFFNALLPILATLQFINGGSIVAFQIENEYGSTNSSTFTPEKEYLKSLRQLYLDNNITELLFTSDGVTTFRDIGTLPDLFLMTANFGDNAPAYFKVLEEIQPGRPKMAMEHYPGWFDHWGENHNTRNSVEFVKHLEEILSYPGSFNLYMMYGGTSFGFMNGANLANGQTDNSGYQPDTTSYDYDGVLTEAGDYTVKYTLLADLLKKYTEIQTKLPEPPSLFRRIAHPNVTISESIPLKTLIETQTVRIGNTELLPMEMLPINNGTGQSYGYIVYRKENLDLEAGSVLRIVGNVRDTLLVLLNGELLSPHLNAVDDLQKFGFWKLQNSTLTLTNETIQNATLDLVVENWGRVGYGSINQYYQYKGLLNDIEIDNAIIEDWIHIPLEFKRSWNSQISQWQSQNNYSGPGLYKGVLVVEDDTRDTYIDMRNWKKGIVIVNGFVLGRYARIGPQQCLYWPAPFIKRGENEIIIFEHYASPGSIIFSQDQIFETYFV